MSRWIFLLAIDQLVWNMKGVNNELFIASIIYGSS